MLTKRFESQVALVIKRILLLSGGRSVDWNHKGEGNILLELEIWEGVFDAGKTTIVFYGPLCTGYPLPSRMHLTFSIVTCPPTLSLTLQGCCEDKMKDRRKPKSSLGPAGKKVRI